MEAGGLAERVHKSKDSLYKVIESYKGAVGNRIEKEFANGIPWEDIDAFTDAY